MLKVFKKRVSLHITSYNFLIIFLFLIAAVLRLWGLGNFDISADESHYISDAYRYFTGDPYSVPRHHPFQHPKPSMGHPFLAQDIMVVFFKIIGPSLYSGRLVMALSNLIALLGTFLLAKALYGKKTALLALLLLTFLPHDIRYARDAHLDPLLGASLIWAVLFFWKVLTSEKIYWGGLLGLTTALTMATKMNAPFLFFFYGLSLALYTKINALKSWIKSHAVQIVTAAISFATLFVFLVDPGSYLDGLLHPADPGFVLSRLVSTFLGNHKGFTPRLVLHLYTVPFIILTTVGVTILLIRRKQADLFLLSLLVVLSHIYITHSGGPSGEYGYIILNPYFTILAAIALISFKQKFRKLAFAIVMVFFLPILILHALRIDIGPFTQLTNFNDSNFRFGQTTYINAINSINQLPGTPIVLWIKDGDRTVPFMNIRGVVRLWPFFQLNEVDTVLLADKEMKNGLITSGQFAEYKNFHYRGKDNLWILVRIK